MAKVTIDDVEYQLADLSDEVKNTLQSMNFVDKKIVDLQMELAATKTARNAYGRSLSENLPDQQTELDENVLRIDDKKYLLSDLSDNARGQAASIRFCDQQLSRLESELAIVQTARQAYAKAVREGLNNQKH
ncbi:MAG: DUF6447 family protein [Hydrogenovibrio sp.]